MNGRYGMVMLGCVCACMRACHGPKSPRRFRGRN